MQFWKDWSAEKILEVDSEHATYNNGILQWIDGSGKHHCELLNDIDVQEGSQEDSKLPVALAIAWNPKTKEKLLSCVNVNYDVLYGEDIQDAILSGLFKEISADNPSKRLLWIDPCDGKDFVYFDPCPNFMQGGGGSLELSARKYDVSPYIAPPYAHLDGEMSVVLSSRADSNVQADIV